jgi:DNA-binding NarL/FixJ family response regulator
MVEYASRILVVDDHPLVREGLCALIAQEKDMQVCGQAADLAGAMELLKTARPDVAIIDLSLKESSGLELIKAARSASPELAVIVLSMHEETSYAERAVRAGAQGYVMKSQATEHVLRAIREVLKGKTYLSERVVTHFAAKFLNQKLPAQESPVALLSDRELQVFELFGQGYRAREIASRLDLSPKTVHSYFGRIREKLQLSNGTQLLREAVRLSGETAAAAE